VDECSFRHATTTLGDDQVCQWQATAAQPSAVISDVATQGRSDKVVSLRRTIVLDRTRRLRLEHLLAELNDLDAIKRHLMRPEEAMTQPDIFHNETDRGNFGKDVDYNRERSPSDDTPSEHSAQAGVRRIEAVSKAWTKTSLIVAYVTYVISITFHHQRFTLLTPD
jgi:hypothetical protein